MPLFYNLIKLKLGFISQKLGSISKTGLFPS
ncbi:hypothetical protein FHS90_003868 [Rufibacter quisquiliarum]|uniref:Uncharacterized protein n=1 Tax=Rufibacter quisquiliarum TaxID=1549639 RepID=A0A839GML7_9BACT|nr:hypothetical protein [Rufibacter quisquiliarum]